MLFINYPAGSSTALLGECVCRHSVIHVYSIIGMLYSVYTCTCTIQCIYIIQY